MPPPGRAQRGRHPIKPLIVALEAAYLFVGAFAAQPVLAADYSNPIGYTLTSPVLLNGSFVGSDTYTNYGRLDTTAGGGLLLSNTSIGQVSNVGVIDAHTGFAVELSHSTIGTLNNSGLLSGAEGIFLSTSSITTLTNTGTISTSFFGVGVDVGSTVGTLNNSGTIGSGSYGITSRGTIGSLINSGVIQGSLQAINAYSGDQIGAVTNTGSIIGDILVSRTLNISGGASTMGTLTGYGGTIGTISITAGDLAFTSGQQLLNDHVTVGTGRTVFNTGATLQINNPLAITGNYSQNAAATLRVGVSDAAVAGGSAATDTGYGRLTVSGSANIASGSSIALTRTGSSYAFAAGQRYVVIAATSAGTSYNADTLNYSATGYSGRISGSAVADGGNSDLVVTLGGPAANQATLGNASQALAGLFNYAGTQSQLLNLYNAALAAGTNSGTANAVGAQLSPVGIASGSARTGRAVGNTVSGVIRGRLGAQRTGSGLSSGDEPLERSAWTQAFGGRIDQGMRDGLAGYVADYSGVLFGVDRKVSDRWRAGTAFSYATSTLREGDANSGSSVRSRAYGLHFYGGFEGDDYYLDLHTSVDAVQYDSARRIAFTGFASNAYGNFNGLQYQASAELGRPIRFGSAENSTTLTPIVDLTYIGLRQSGYSESGGNGAALKVDATHDNSFTSQIGTRLEQAIDTRWGGLTPYVQLGWRHEYLNSRLQTSASFAADPSGSTAFTNSGAKPVSDTASLALGATLRKTEQLALSARILYDAAPGFQSLGGNIALRYLF